MYDMENRVDLLEDEIRRLSQLIEHLTARDPGAAPPLRIVPISLSGTTGTLQDFDGTNYVDMPLAGGVPTSERQITVQSPSVARAIWSPISRRWELLSGGTWVGVLAGDLNYHSSATVNLYSFDSGLGYFTSSGQTDTCYPWLLLTGDLIPSGTQVVGCYVSGKRVVYDAACNTGT